TNPATDPFFTVTGPSTWTLATLAPGASADFFFDVTIQRTAAAYGTQREFHITATADTLGTVSTPDHRAVFVQQLISQNRNGIDSITGPTTVFVGNTYTFTMNYHTATNGYEELESSMLFNTSIFRVLSVATTYTAPPGGTN